MYEHRTERLLPFPAFLRRLAAHGGAALGVVGGSLLIGVVGYHSVAGLNWVDSLLNASMILGGMGPVDPLTTTAGKVFASIYALFSGIVFLGAVAVLLAPFVHRLLHKFHVEESGG